MEVRLIPMLGSVRSAGVPMLLAGRRRRRLGIINLRLALVRALARRLPIQLLRLLLRQLLRLPVPPAAVRGIS